VIAMMLVDWTGSWEQRYAVFEHANWLGVTLPDFIFPSLLFVAGFAIPLAVDREAPPERLLRRVVRRSLLLFGCRAPPELLLGLGAGRAAAAQVPGDGRAPALRPRLSRGRAAVPGPPPRRLMAVTAAILVGYWLLVAFVPVPGFGSPDLTINPHGRPLTPTLATWLDERVLGRHMAIFYPHDPEGLLTTLPALATTLIGVIAGAFWHQGAGSEERRLVRLFAWGVGLVIGGELWSLAFPLGKKLWTSSFVLFTGGFALLVLAALQWRLDLPRRRRFIGLPVWYGANAFLAIIAFTFLDNLLRVMRLKDAVFAGALPRSSRPRRRLGVLGRRILLLALPLRFLHRRRLFIRA
jgi:predicted acyltransferase